MQVIADANLTVGNGQCGHVTSLGKVGLVL